MKNTKEAKELTGQVTKEQIEIWKKKYGQVNGIIVSGHICYLKPVDRKTLSFASSVGAKDPLKFNEVILDNCWLGGSEEIKTDDTLFLSAGAKLAELIEIRDAEIVKF
ncbi:MAG: hypothetical protein NTZ33_13855 [Bacteroidetes bacterium]|nr:hypothetical protein [Bacteroidota bacterium]